MTMIATSRAPQSLIDWLVDHTREDDVLGHAVTVGLDWWNADRAHLPGHPVTAAGVSTGTPVMSRREIFTLADDAVEDDSGTAALRLLWHALAWGTGKNQRGNARRIRGVMSAPEVSAELLRDAARLSRTDPEAAFALLRPKRRNTISHLGPGFFTKFLYFAGGGDSDHPCVIVDSVVRAKLDDETGRTNPWLRVRFNYPVGDYLATLELMGMWAESASAVVGRPVATDEVEKWAFGR